MSQISRRDFLRASVITAVGAAAASCAQPTPQVIEKPVTVVVEKEVQVEKEVLSTVIVEKEVAVEKVVQQTVLVEKEKVVKETVVVEREKQVDKVITATPVISKYGESPQLAGMVRDGKLPPVQERLPEEPLVITPVEEIGQYGGTWHRLSSGPTDLQLNGRITYCAFNRFNHFGTELVPDVSTSFEVNADGSVYTYKLRKGMKWSDGSPYTADDMVFYFTDDLGVAELSGTPGWLQPHGKLASLDKVDDYTIRLDFHGPYALFPTLEAYNAGLPDRPAEYLKQFHIKYADKAALDAALKEAGFEQWYQLYSNKQNLELNPERPSMRAWVMFQPSPKQPIVAVRNPYYWKVDTEGNQLPYIDRIEFMVVQSGDIVNLRAASGEVDMQLRHMTFANYPIFKDSEEKGDYRVLEWPWGENEIVVHFTQNSADPVKKPLLEDKRFRFALSLAVNRQEICDAIYYGTVEPSQIVPYPSSPWWTEERAMYMADYDPDRANAYLDDMGLTGRDSEGYRLMPDGKRLVISWDYAPIFGPWGPVGELVREHYQKIGVDLQIREVARSLFYERFRAGETDLGLWTGHSTFYPILTPRDFAAISYGGSKWAAQYGWWWETGGSSGIEPPADSDIRKSQLLYDKCMASPTVQDAFDAFDELMDNFYDNLWTMGFTTPPIQPVIVKNNFRNVPDGVLSTWSLRSPGATAPEQYFFKQ